MSSEILSQNEIDALLSAISKGEMDADELKRDQEERKIKVYDFKRALRFSKEHIRSLERIYENFARILTTYFSAQLRTYVNIQVTSADQLPYEEFVRSVPKMTIMNVFELNPLEGRMLIEINPNIAYAMLDRMLGGVGISVNKIETLTEIEKRLMIQLFEKAFDLLSEAWSNVVEVQPEMIDFEVNPQFLQLVSPNETVVVISLTTTVGDTSGIINVCMPHVLLEPIIPKLSSHYWMQNQKKQNDSDEKQLLEKKIEDVPVNITARLGTSEMTIYDFLHLDMFDVIQLNEKISDPVSILVGDEPKFIGQPGVVKKKLAVQILDINKRGNSE